MADVIVGVVVFPGSNCDHDTEYAVASFEGVKPVMLWHNEHDLKGANAIVLPVVFPMATICELDQLHVFRQSCRR